MVYFYIISVVIVVFSLLGIFGNLNIIWATCRKKHFRGKHGLLLANLAVHQLICLTWQWVNLTYSLHHQTVMQDHCYTLIFPYIFAVCAQAMMYLVITGDLLAAILIPLRHHFINNYTYVFAVSVPVWIYSAVVTIWGAIDVEHKEIVFCNPTLSINGTAHIFWLHTNLANVIFVIVLHVVAWQALKRKFKRCASVSQPSIVSRTSTGEIFATQLQYENGNPYYYTK
ncbi:unnamed protein product [Nippostrongylus brasiliensis]|uniref:G_PROTEIN_RECEP_F1_2 domain-containing protein n=1 Tax=Nippostrongylus brasiliensis TaxID=27835 RepID=A0A158R167_NIPBR|nr:unnamed protein product [Nippostrongylus brasiliensis]